MSKFQYVVLALVALAFAILVIGPSQANARGAYCFTLDQPPRAHGNYEPVTKWEWDNRTHT